MILVPIFVHIARSQSNSHYPTSLAMGGYLPTYLSASANTLTTGGEAQLKGLLSDHASLTGSIKATRLLEDWDNSLKKFWQVIPASEESNPAVIDGDTGVAASSEATTPLVAAR